MDPKLRQQYQHLQILIYALQLETWPFEEIDKPAAFAEIIKFSQSLGLEIDPTDPAFLPTIQAKINALLATPVETTPNIPPNLRELVEIYEEANQKQQIKIQRLIFPTLDEQIKNLRSRYAQKIRQELVKNEPALSQNPELTEEISQNLVNKLITNLPSTARPELFTPNEYANIVNQSQPAIIQELKKAGIANPQIEKTTLERLTQETLSEAKTMSATPRNIFPTRTTLKTLPSEKISPSILVKMAPQPEGIASPLVFNLVYPPTAISFAKKIILTPIVKPLQWIARNAEGVIPQAKLAIVKGLTSQDLQESITTLKNLGLPSEHPQINKLDAQGQRFQEFESSHKVLSFILRNYYEYPKKLNQLQIQEPETGLFLPRLSPSPVWQRQRGYTWRIRQGLNKFGFLTGTQKRISLAPEKTVIRSAFYNFRQFVYQKTLKPFFTWLGKTAFGTAVKSGTKKFATWAATKLGLSAGAVAGPVGALVFALPQILPKIKEILKKTAIAMGSLLIAAAQLGTGAFLGALGGAISGLYFSVQAALGLGPFVSAFLTPVLGPLAYIVGPMGTGAVVWVGSTAAGLGIGMWLQSIWGKLTSFLSKISISQSITSFIHQVGATAVTALGKIVPGVAASAGVGTLIISQVVSSSFIIPKEGEIKGSHYIQVKKGTQFSRKIGDKINYTIQVEAVDKPLTGVEIIDEPSASCRGQTPNLQKRSFSQEEITPGTPWQTKYNVPTNETFNNCLIINRVTVTANVEGEPERQQTSIVNTISLGNPPEDCPLGWPTTQGYVSQGPNGPFSHQGLEAIDIVMPMGSPVYATHKGFVTIGETWGGGNGVWLTGSCGGIQFRSTYLHLEYWTVENGQQVNRGDRIGISGNSGNSTGPHLHYEFKPAVEPYWTTDKKLEMAPPYIPQIVPEGCNSQEGCHTSW